LFKTKELNQQQLMSREILKNQYWGLKNKVGVILKLLLPLVFCSLVTVLVVMITNVNSLERKNVRAEENVVRVEVSPASETSSTSAVPIDSDFIRSQAQKKQQSQSVSSSEPPKPLSSSSEPAKSQASQAPVVISAPPPPKKQEEPKTTAPVINNNSTPLSSGSSSKSEEPKKEEEKKEQDQSTSSQPPFVQENLQESTSSTSQESEQSQSTSSSSPLSTKTSDNGSIMISLGGILGNILPKLDLGNIRLNNTDWLAITLIYFISLLIGIKFLDLAAFSHVNDKYTSGLRYAAFVNFKSSVILTERRVESSLEMLKFKRQALLGLRYPAVIAAIEAVILFSPVRPKMLSLSQKSEDNRLSYHHAEIRQPKSISVNL
jgi:hypothetical protein